MMRSTKWSLGLIQDSYDATHSAFADHPWWEQSSMFYLISNMCREERNTKIMYVNQEIVNPYPKEYSNSIHKHYVDDASFVLAFSGCNTYVTREKCNSLYTKYAEIALRRR